ncbi:hypothetical protein HYS91_02905 [Candidatus Daviesbacteria bacterium]|nr:hypothetical protein [Candidatus Daviesbacteria bacterium]
MKKRIINTTITFSHLIIFSLLSALVSFIYWIWAGKDYIFAKTPIGGDYFNALTYAQFFKDHLNLPPQGWVPFWNEGSPIISGYPWAFFYLLYPLTKYFDLPTAMDYLSIAFLLLFFIFSLTFFYQAAKNWLVASAFVLILLITRASYYPLMTGGFISSASAMWYLPAILFLILKFADSKKQFFLILASILEGLSLIHHAPTSLLMVIAPTTLVLALLPNQGNIKKRFFTTVKFLIISFLIGAMSLYTVILQAYLGSGSGACASPQCWGIYPKHLITWLNPLTLGIIGGGVMLILITRIIKRDSKSVELLLPLLLGFAFFVFYAMLAKLELINGFANVIFPTRTFWAANLFALGIGAISFRIFNLKFRKIGHILALIILIGIAIPTYLYSVPPDIHHDFTATDPLDVAIYTIPKYQTKQVSELVADFVPLNEANWRLDSFNPGLIHWWNYVATTPSVRGYSNHPVGKLRDWQYFLQTSTRDPQDENQELIKNRAHFLIDAFGIGFRDNSVASYPISILSDQSLITKSSPQMRSFSWMQLSQDKFSPIIYPTNSPAVLFIGDEGGYENFLRAIALVNLNSKVLTPVRGPNDIGKISLDELNQFDLVVAYGYKGNNFDKIARYVKNGKALFIDTASGSDQTLKNTADIFPLTKLSKREVKESWKSVIVGREFALNVDSKLFSPFSFQGGNWKLNLASESNLRSWGKTIVKHNQNVLIAGGQLEKGKVIWSGANLFYHLVTNNNFEEAKLIKNIFDFLLPEVQVKPEYSVNRISPEKAIIEAKNIRGIYFKENFDLGWRAKMNDQSLKIYPAGMGFMYVPLKKEVKEATISLDYGGSLLAWLLFLISIISFVFTLIYLLLPKPFILISSAIQKPIIERFNKKVKELLKEEDE